MARVLSLYLQQALGQSRQLQNRQVPYARQKHFQLSFPSFQKDKLQGI